MLNHPNAHSLKEELSFLGHIISNKGIRPDPEKVKAISLMPAPSNWKELQIFLWMIAYVQRFIPDCADLIAPLSILTGNKKLLSNEMKLEIVISIY